MELNTLDYMIRNHIFSLLDQIDEDPVLIWVFAENERWYLCCQCDDCEVWMEYPGVQHVCSDIILDINTPTALGVIRYQETNIEELTNKLLCGETLSDFED